MKNLGGSLSGEGKERSLRVGGRNEEKETKETKEAFPLMWWCRRSSSPAGPLPKNEDRPAVHMLICRYFSRVLMNVPLLSCTLSLVLFN